MNPRRSAYDPRLAFGLAVRSLREDRGLSQEKLAELADMHRTYVGMIERGERSPAVQMIWNLAGALGIRPSELVAAAEE